MCACVRAGLLTQHEQQSDDVDQDHVGSGGNLTGHADGSGSVSRAVPSGSLALSPRCVSHSLPANSDMLEASRYPWRRSNGESLDHLHPHSSSSSASSVDSDPRGVRYGLHIPVQQRVSEYPRFIR